MDIFRKTEKLSFNIPQFPHSRQFFFRRFDFLFGLHIFDDFGNILSVRHQGRRKAPLEFIYIQ